MDPLDKVCGELSADACDYGWHLLVYARTYPSNAYYSRTYRTFLAVLGLQFGADPLIVELALLTRNIDSVEFDFIGEGYDS